MDQSISSKESDSLGVELVDPAIFFFSIAFPFHKIAHSALKRSGFTRYSLFIVSLQVRESD